MTDKEKLYQAHYEPDRLGTGDKAIKELHKITSMSKKDILTALDVASRYKVTRPLRTKKSGEVAFVLEAIYKKGGVFKYLKVFQCDNGSEFKNEMTKLLEKHNVDIRRATAKYKKTHTAFV